MRTTNETMRIITMGVRGNEDAGLSSCPVVEAAAERMAMHFAGAENDGMISHEEAIWWAERINRLARECRYEEAFEELRQVFEKIEDYTAEEMFAVIETCDPTAGRIEEIFVEEFLDTDEIDDFLVEAHLRKLTDVSGDAARSFS
jgi:hypothetical protein